MVFLKYLGTAYSGWQIQPNAPTVQQAVCDAAEKLFCEKAGVTGCSRTDAGVHANSYCCSIRTSSALPCATVVGGLNAYLPYDIAVTDCREAAPDFHARYDCKGKEYLYLIHNSPVRDPFLTDRAWHCRYPIDEAALDSASRAFVGTHDFAAFCSAGSSVTSTVRTVKSFSVRRDGDKVMMTVEADGFLYNMVRIMVGTLIDVQAGKIAADSLPEVILSKDRGRAGVTAPPQGLYLNRVFY